MILIASVVTAPILFAACALLTKAPVHRLKVALLGGLIFAAGNVGWDVVATLEGWWTYPDGAKPIYYAAAGLSFAAISLIAWRVYLRFGPRGLIAFVPYFALYGMVRDIIVSHLARDLIVFHSGKGTWAIDAAAWASLAAISFAIQFATKEDVPVS